MMMCSTPLLLQGANCLYRIRFLIRIRCNHDVSGVDLIDRWPARTTRPSTLQVSCTTFFDAASDRCLPARPASLCRPFECRRNGVVRW
jgi:hypothetical protein